MEDRTVHADYKLAFDPEPWYMNSHLIPIWLFLAVLIIILSTSLILTIKDHAHDSH